MEIAFTDQINLAEALVSNRQALVDDLDRRLFGARGRANAQHGDREAIAAALDACFFQSPPIPLDLSRLAGQLDAAHLADGFEPGAQDGYARGFDPVELVLRACHHWESTRWPGRHGRLLFAQSLFHLFVLHRLERLTLRIWDGLSSAGDRPSSNELAAERLHHVQRVLELLNESSGSGPVMHPVRDARWLIQTAQGPLTRHVMPYFVKAEHVSAWQSDARLEIHRAGAVLAGGHLRSQLRRLPQRTGWTSDDPRLLALTRSSNSMDMALLIRDLVPLLEAYAAACRRSDADARLALADLVIQGLSADPELLVTRLDLLGPSTTIEALFVEPGGAAFTALGEAHRRYLGRYIELLGQTAGMLRQDIAAFDPARAPYSPLGIVYGFCADLLSNMALDTLSSPPIGMSLEDLFNSRERLDEKATLSARWARLPKREGEPDAFEHSRDWASQMFAWTTEALDARSRSSGANASSQPTARLYVTPAGVRVEALADGLLPAGVASAQEHVLTSDIARARAIGATALPADRLAADRAEGRLLASVRADGAWFGISKVPLTLYTSRGTHALMTDVPQGVIDVLRTVCPDLLVVLAGS